MKYGIAIDLGTSGFRAQSVDLSSGEIISTAITTHHPLPGANVIDHIHFALEMGTDTACGIIIRAVSRVIGHLHIPLKEVERIAVCGNPIQLSLFQGMEIRDLAYAGERKLKSLGVEPLKRKAAVLKAQDIAGLNLSDGCSIIVPPAVSHHVGADALAMIIKTGMLDKKETSLATDYGTNAEMALFHEGRVITGSTAAGPALEGQQIACGMLAVPGVISDLEPDPPYHRLIILDSEMLPVQGALIDLENGRIITEGQLRPIGITGTGTIAIMNRAAETGLITIPHINTANGELNLSQGIFFTEQDMIEAGKAIGAVRAGHLTLCHEAGIAPEDIHTVYMSGASGTYVDAHKAYKIGMIPPRVKTVFQIGNTSLSMAADLVKNPALLDYMSDVAEKLRDTHCVFAESKTFEKVYILELSYWTEGMPMSQYRKFLKKYRLPDLLPPETAPEVVRTVRRDIDELGKTGLSTVTDIGDALRIRIEDCSFCMACVKECPAKAISVIEDAPPVTFVMDQSLCYGVSCRRCERVCPRKTLRLEMFFQ